MNTRLRVALILALVLYFISIWKLLKKGKMSLQYSLLWIFSGGVMFVLAMFPKLLDNVANFLGIIDYRNGLFAAILFGLIMLLMYLNTLVTELGNKIRILIQEIALLEKRVRELEEKK